MPNLKRQLGFWDSVAINVGIIIGVGIFRTPGEIAKFVDTPLLILLTWFWGAVISLIGVFCFAELSSRFPHTGGTYVFLRESCGKAVGFLFGWAEFAILRAGSIAAVSYVFTDYLYQLVPWPESTQKIAVIAAILFFTLINAVGIKLGTGVQNILSAVKVISIIAVSVLIFTCMKQPLLISGVRESKISFSNVMAMAPAMIPMIWTYGGWHQSTFMSGEFKDTKRALPLSLVLGIFIVAALYILINAAYLNVMTPGEMTQSKAIASEIFSQLFGAPGKLAITLVVMMSAGGALNSTIMTGGRIPFAVAQDHPRMSWIAQVDPKFGTPLRSLAVNAVWASALVLWGNFEQLLFFFSFANWLFFALVGYTVFVFRKRQGVGEHVFPTPFYPWIPLLFTSSALWLCWTSIQNAPRESTLGALILLAGLVVYGLLKTKESEKISAK